LNGKQSALEVLVFGRTGFVGSFVFSASKVSIGRARDAMVRLDDPHVSLQHAVLLMDGGLFRIKDLGSRTGTRVNGAPILPRQPLEPTDEVSIGPFRLRVTTCEPDSVDSDRSPDEATRRLPSMGTGISAPTAPPFFPPSEGVNGSRNSDRPPPARTREAAAPQFAREERRADPIPASGFNDSGLLADSGETTTVMPSTRPSTRPPPRERDVVKAAPPTSVATSPTVLVPVPFFPTRSGTGAPGPSQAAPAKTANIHPDTALDVVPFAFAMPEGGRVDDDDDEDDDIDFVPPFDLLEALSRGGIDDDQAHVGRALSLEVIHHRADRIVSVRHPRTKGPIRRPGSAEAIGTLEEDGTFSLYPEECRKFSLREGGRTVPTAEALARREGRKMRLPAGAQASIALEGDDEVLIHWVPRAHELPVPPIAIKPTRDQTTTGGLSIAVHIATMLFIGLVVLSDNKDQEAELNAGRFATVDQKELELQPPPPPPPPEEVPTADVAPTVDTAPLTKHDPTAPKSKVPVTKGPHQSSQEASANAASNASAQKILSALGGAPSALSAIAVTNLDALPAGAGSFKVSGSVGKAPGDSLRVAAAGATGKDVDTKSINEVGPVGPHTSSRRVASAGLSRRRPPRQGRDPKGRQRPPLPGTRLLRASAREGPLALRQDLLRMGCWRNRRSVQCPRRSIHRPQHRGDNLHPDGDPRLAFPGSHGRIGHRHLSVCVQLARRLSMET
jgi:hypothetical protein